MSLNRTRRAARHGTFTLVRTNTFTSSKEPSSSTAARKCGRLDRARLFLRDSPLLCAVPLGVEISVNQFRPLHACFCFDQAALLIERNHPIESARVDAHAHKVLARAHPHPGWGSHPPPSRGDDIDDDVTCQSRNCSNSETISPQGAARARPRRVSWVGAPRPLLLECVVLAGRGPRGRSAVWS